MSGNCSVKSGIGLARITSQSCGGVYSQGGYTKHDVACLAVRI